MVPIFGSRTASGATSYVYADSVGGSDVNSGTQASPVKTLAKALTLVAIGGYLFLKRGSSFTETFTLTFLIYVQPYGTGAAPIINGSANLVGNTWTDIGGGRSTTPYNTFSATNPRPSLLSYDGAAPTSRQASQAAVDGPGKWYWNAGILTRWTGSYTSIAVDQSFSVYVRAPGCIVSGLATTWGVIGIVVENCNNCVIDSMETYGNGHHGMSVIGSAAIGVQSCTINNLNTHDNIGDTQNGNHGLNIGGTTTLDITNVTGVVVNGLTSTHNGEDGMQVRSTAGGTVLTVDGCVITNNLENSFDHKGGIAIVKNFVFDQTGTYAQQGPFVTHTDTPFSYLYDGIMLANQTNPTTCFSVLEGANCAAYRVKVLTGSHYGIIAQSDAGSLYLESVVVTKTSIASRAQAILIDSEQPVTLKQCAIAPTSVIDMIPLSITGGGGVTSIDTIYYCPSTSTSVYCVQTEEAADDFTGTGDLYLKGEDTALIKVAATTAKTKAQVAAGINQFGLVISSAVVTDPLFNGVANSDLSLQAGSPALGTGVPSGVLLDVNKVAFPSPTNIGAYAT